MKDLSEAHILEALRRLHDPVSGRDIVSAGMVSGIALNDGRVRFVITIDPKEKKNLAWLHDAAEKEVRMVPGVSSVSVVLTAQSDNPEVKKPAIWNLTPVEGVARVIAVASGKGGVGKSTTAVNLAHAFAAQGKRVGLLDADIYGPSLPRMMALSGKPDFKEGKMQPLVAHGIRCMSMGFLLGDEAAVMRGPMITKALHQLLRGTSWGTLDVLLVDMPPGTGDVHISMAQQVPISGAVIVTTPQPVATIDAKKCLTMFRKLDVPILGVIENMSGFADAATGRMSYIFGQGGGKTLAAEAGVPFLGEVPIETGIREAADSGAAYHGAARAQYAAMAQNL
jgi:ATP-binding protein involved in chromosome partitioning